jgi:hypothetical protein
VGNVGKQHEATDGKRRIGNPSIGSAIATYLRRLARRHDYHWRPYRFDHT